MGFLLDLSLEDLAKDPIMPNARTIADVEWEGHKSVLGELYEKATLRELMRLMEHDHNFVASLVHLLL